MHSLAAHFVKGMPIEDTLTCVRECISQIQDKFNAYPALYFNESDLQCELFALLLDRFGDNCEISNVFVWGTDKITRTRQCISRRVHSELLLPGGRIDLAILDLSHVRFAMNSRGRFGHIQLEPGGHVFIEIKASRTNRSSITSKNSWIQSIERDIDNLNAHAYRSFMLCFDFGGILDDLTIARLIARKRENVEFLYFTNEIRDNYLAPD